jgi:RNA polymerase sigma-70 factor (ECF subfamily)
MGVTSDEQRLEELWLEHGPAVLAYSRRRLGSDHDARDVTAEVFLTAWRLVDKVPPGPGARLWLFGVARNACLNYHRGEHRRGELAARIAQLQTMPLQAGDEETMSGVVREALSRLTERDRELLTLIAWDGLSPAEAAQVLGLPGATVRVRLHRARERLRMHLRRLGVPAAPKENSDTPTPALKAN